ncbi:MAG: iron ABC transporter permease [SAR202 cluster bacterium]|nr:iron ABC transporter permease [SAR202 cluster bacterium]
MPYAIRTGGPPLLIVIAAAVVATAMALPLTYLVIRTAAAGAVAWDIIFQWDTALIMGRTLLLALAVTSSALAIALPVAWLTVRTDMPGRRVLAVATTLPLVVPSYVNALALVSALGPRGILQQWLEGPFGVDRLPDIHGFPGAWLALTLSTYPYLLLSIRAALWGMDPAMEEASRSLGRNAWSTFRSATLPHLRPAIAAGGLLIALYTMGDFGAVALMSFDSFTRVIFVQIESSFDRTVATALSIVLGLFTLGLVVAEQQARGRASYHAVGLGAQRPPLTVKLRRLRWPAAAFCALVVLSALGLPVAVLLYWLREGLAHNVEITFPTRSILNGVYVSGFAALGAVIASAPIVVLAVRFPGRLARIVEGMTWTGFALPGIVVALSLVFFGINFATPLYQTAPMLMFAYCVLFLPVAVGAIRTSLLQLSPQIEESARSLGSAPLGVLVRVTAPLVWPGLMVGAALVFMTTMKELPATLLLAPAGFRTLATDLWAASAAASYSRAAVPALLLILVSTVPVAILLNKENRGR